MRIYIPKVRWENAIDFAFGVWFALYAWRHAPVDRSTLAALFLSGYYLSSSFWREYR